MNELVKLDDSGKLIVIPDRRAALRPLPAPNVGLTKTAAAARMAIMDVVNPGYAQEVLHILATEKPR